MTSRDMFFLRIIAEALDQPDPNSALKHAFENIETLGRQPEYRDGFSQFQQFMSMVKKGSGSHAPETANMALDLIRELSIELATGLFDENPKEKQDILDMIHSRPEWRGEYENIKGSISEAEEPTIELFIEANEGRLISIPVEQQPFTRIIRGIKPGSYSIKLNTGRMLWEGDLSAKELFWANAFPEQALDLAADTEGATARCTKEIILLNGELIVRVFPEIESGYLEVELKIKGNG
jgi:hypothetical protein